MSGDAAHVAGKAWMQANGRVATLCNFSDSPLEATAQRMLSNIMQLKKPISVADKLAAYHGGIHLLGLISALDM